MERGGKPKLPPGLGPDPDIPRMNQELADAFSNAVFGLLETNCKCPSAKFVRLLVKYRKDMFKGGEVTGESHDIAED